MCRAGQAAEPGWEFSCTHPCCVRMASLRDIQLGTGPSNRPPTEHSLQRTVNDLAGTAAATGIDRRYMDHNLSKRHVVLTWRVLYGSIWLAYYKPPIRKQDITKKELHRSSPGQDRSLLDAPGALRLQAM